MSFGTISPRLLVWHAVIVAINTVAQRRVNQVTHDDVHPSRLDSPEFVTICAWTGSVLWRGSWVSIERYLRERFGVEVTHGISTDGRRLFEDESRSPGDVYRQ